MTLGLRHHKKHHDTEHHEQHRILDMFIYPVGLISPLALIPQIWTIYETQNASGVSLLTWILLMAGNAAWLIYGFVHREIPLMMVHAAFLVANIAIIIGIIQYA